MPNNKTKRTKGTRRMTKTSSSKVSIHNISERKKKRLIIESSSSSPKDKDEDKDKEKEKEKIDLINSSKLGETKIDLKISQDMKPPMNYIPLPSGRLNEKFIELMEKLSDIMLKQGEPFRARAYQKAQETIMSYPSDIVNPDVLKGKSNIGPTIMEKLDEYVKTGTLKVLEREKSNPVNILAEVYGIGPKKAKELVDNGITSIVQLRQNQQQLNDVQKVGLRYYEDVLKRIPRSEIEEYKSIFEMDFKQVATPDSRFEIVGSYRRGAISSGDIDVIITSDNPKIFVNFIDLLIKQKVLLEILSRGPTKCLVIAKIPTSDTARRVDFLYSSPEEYPFSVLYFTGSKIFNTVMRHQAIQMGLTMNEHGLYHLIDNGKKKGEKVKYTFTNEKDIFDYLHIEYKTPEERIDGRAVIIKTPEKKKPKLIIEEDDSEEYILTPLPKKNSNKPYTNPPTNPPTKPPTKKILIIESDSVDEDKKNIHIIAIVNEFKKKGIPVLEKLNENQLSSVLREANKAYYNDEPIMTDNEYDIIKEYIEQKYPSNEVIHQIGAPVEKNKATLPYPMGSMDKIKPDTNALTNWMSKYKGPYVLSCKLDGVSGLYTTEGSEPKLYTRGDGKVGQDVSHLIPHLRLPKTKGIVIRGEFIISKALFETKYKTKFANPRNMVAGIVNHKTINASVHDLHFVAYEVIKPTKTPSEQFEFLKTIDVEVVLNKRENNLSNALLSQTLIDWRKTYTYEIDGVIVTDDKIYPHKAGNPEHAFAFKMVLSEQIAEAKVINVIWTPSKDGYLKPRVQIEPINLGGVKIEYATGFNGAFINDNKVGVGAIIELIRSGDVIPHIRKVNVPAEKAQMPTVPYKWNNTNVDIMLEDLESDETVREKVVTGFFRGVGVEGLSSGNVARIMKAGFDTVPQIIKMSKEDFLVVDGFKEKTATKLYDGIREKIKTVSLVTIMSASNIFGRGFSDKKLELIMDSYPNVLLSTESNLQKVNKIASIKGMAEKTAESFVERIPEFIHFIKEAGLVKKLTEGITTEKKIFDESHPLFGRTVVITGFRDQNLQDELKNKGAKLGTSVSKTTFVVLVKDIDDDTSKTEEARKLKIPIMTPHEFISKYL